jgi:hypothetical protein
VSAGNNSAAVTGNLSAVLLDINYPAFQSQFFALDATEIRKVLKTFQKISLLTWSDVFKDHGLKWEAIKSVQGKYTIRLSQSYRAVVIRQGNYMRFQSLHLDHDGAYGKK